jgi:hypothetical protein
VLNIFDMERVSTSRRCGGFVLVPSHGAHVAFLPGEGPRQPRSQVCRCLLLLLLLLPLVGACPQKTAENAGIEEYAGT